MGVFAGAATWWRERVSDRGGEEGPRPAWPDVLRAHKAWFDAPDDAAAERKYVAALEGFERHQGRIEEAYWCTSVPSGAAITIRGGRRRFHRATAWAAQDDQRVAVLLNECDELAVRVSEVLRGVGQRIGMGLVLRTTGNLLALLDERSTHPDPKQVELAIRAERENYEQARHYYARTARRQAQLVFVGGMLLGVVALLGLVLGILAILHVAADVRWFPHRDQSIGSLTPLYLCAISGALGADVSVASRIDENTFSVDYELGRVTLALLGAIRPLLGAVFGIALYAALASGVLELFKVPQGDITKQLLFFMVVAFLAGFSERWAKGVLGGLAHETPPAPPKKPSAPAGGPT
jgi:hypothetical protein